MLQLGGFLDVLGEALLRADTEMANKGVEKGITTVKNDATAVKNAMPLLVRKAAE